MRSPSRRIQIGNRPAFVEQLKEKGLPFSFLVISDTHNDENGYALLGEMLKKNDASFVIHVGDAVSAPSIWMHRYFVKRMAEKVKPHIPVFLAPGNHDIYYGFQRVPEDQRVTPEVYQSYYGAMSFDFTYNNCLFILCGVDLKKPDAFVDDLRSVLSRKAAGKKYVFLFLHYPPDVHDGRLRFPPGEGVPFTPRIVQSHFLFFRPLPWISAEPDQRNQYDRVGRRRRSSEELAIGMGEVSSRLEGHGR